MDEELPDAGWREVQALLWEKKLYMLHSMFIDGEPSYVLMAIMNSAFMTYLDVNYTQPRQVWLTINTVPAMVLILSNYEKELQVWHRAHSRVLTTKHLNVFTVGWHWLLHIRKGCYYRPRRVNDEGLSFRKIKLYVMAFALIVVIIGAIMLPNVPEASRGYMLKAIKFIFTYISGT